MKAEGWRMKYEKAGVLAGDWLVFPQGTGSFFPRLPHGATNGDIS
jgi:hypothetical protein